MTPKRSAHFADLLARHEMASAFAAPSEEAIAHVYSVIAPEFDIPFYLASNEDIARARRLDPVLHYIRAGAKEGRDPTPWFSSAAYLAADPELAKSGVNPFYHWLTEGRSAGRECPAPAELSRWSEALGLSPQEVFQTSARRMSDLRERLFSGPLLSQIQAAEALEPDVGGTWAVSHAVSAPPVGNPLALARIGAGMAIRKALGPRPAKVVIAAAPQGAGLRAAGPISELAQRIVSAEDVVLLGPNDLAKPGSRAVDIAAVFGDMPEISRSRLLAELLRGLGPEVVIDFGCPIVGAALSAFGNTVLDGTTLIGPFESRARNVETAFLLRTYDELWSVDGAGTIPTEAARRVRYLGPPPVEAPVPEDVSDTPIIAVLGSDHPALASAIGVHLAERFSEARIQVWGLVPRADGWPERPANLIEGKGQPDWAEVSIALPIGALSHDLAAAQLCGVSVLSKDDLTDREALANAVGAALSDVPAARQAARSGALETFGTSTAWEERAAALLRAVLDGGRT